MKISSKILTLSIMSVVIICSLPFTGMNWASTKYYPKNQDVKTVNQSSAVKKFEDIPNDSLQKILCDKQSPLFINLDPGREQKNVALNPIIKFTVVDSFLPKPKYEWDRYGVDTDSIFISITSRNWSVTNERPHNITLVDSIFEVDCEYYPAKSFDWSDTVKVHLSAQDVSYLRNSADTTYYFHTIRDSITPILTPLYPLPEMVNVSKDSTIRIQCEEVGRGIDLTDIKFEINGLPVNPTIIGDTLNFEISYIPETGWSYNDSIDVFCEVHDLDGNIGTLDYWFKTLATPSPPELMSPPIDAVTQNTKLTLEWYKSENATSYGLEVSANKSFEDALLSERNLNDLKYDISELSEGVLYYWRANATNDAGTSDWSEIWYFSTQKKATSDLRPLPPKLIAPANDAVNQNTSLPFLWNISERASMYRLEVSKDPNFNALEFESETKTVSQNISGLLENNIYYWRVNASNVQGTSEWSEVWHFTTTERTNNRFLLPPQLVYPPNGADGLDTSLTLAWHQSKRALKYAVQVSLTSDFSELVHDNLLKEETTFTLNELLQGTIYYWRVKALNDEESSAWSKIWHFTTKMDVGNQPPLPPELVLPLNGAINQDTSLTLVWKESESATQYGVQLSLDSNFTNFRYEEITDIQIVVDRLEKDTTYFWRANASNAAGTSNWSEAWHFRTISMRDNTSPIIIALDPDSGEANVPITSAIYFRVWDEMSGIDTMNVRVSIESERINVINGKPEVLKEGEHEADFRYQPEGEFAYLDKVKVHIHAKDLAGNPAEKHFDFETEPEILANLKVFNFKSSADGKPIKVEAPVSFEAFISCEFADCKDSFSIGFYLENSEGPFYNVTKKDLQVGETITIPTLPIQLTTEGRYLVTVMVDVSNAIVESNESDNEATIYVQVGGAQLTVRSNPFTPNKDGFNDEAEFNFEQFQVESPNLKIFDMHGKKVREFDQHNNKRFVWNGLDSNGRSLLPGIYLYIFSDRTNALARGCIAIAK